VIEGYPVIVSPESIDGQIKVLLGLFEAQLSMLFLSPLLDLPFAFGLPLAILV
jgi:hypothetical protein